MDSERTMQRIYFNYVLHSCCGRTGIQTMFHVKCLGDQCIKKQSFYETENEIFLMLSRYL
jgi:hypothetical protein